MTVAVLGSINMDVIAYSARLPRPGETIHGTSYRTGLGGKGANQAAAVARLGARVAMIGRVGGDGFGAQALSELASHGVDTAAVSRDANSATGIALIGVGEGGQNVITVIAGANAAVGADDVARAAVILGAARAVLLQLEVPVAASLAAAAKVRASGGIAILDPAPALPSGLPGDVYAAIDVLTPNESETEALIGTAPRTAAEGIAAARALIGRGVGTAVVKMGSLGVAYAAASGDGFLPAFKVVTIDTVAAGDCFNGALAVALAEGSSIAAAVRFAAAAGALSTTKPGAAASAPTRQEVEALLGMG